MNYTITLIALLIPGFFGIGANKLFKGDSEDVPVSSCVLKYFFFTFFSWLIQLWIRGDYFFNNILLGNIIINDKNLLFTIDFLIVILVAIFFGAVWYYFLENLLCKLASVINIIFGKSAVFFDKKTINKNADKNIPHFYEISCKDGKIIRGFLEDTNACDNSLVIKPDDEYKNGSIKEETMQTLVFLDTGITIREYRYQYINGEWSDQIEIEEPLYIIKIRKYGIRLIIFAVGVVLGYVLH